MNSFRERSTSGYVGYDPTLETVIVSHQGTDPEEMSVARF